MSPCSLLICRWWRAWSSQCFPGSESSICFPLYSVHWFLAFLETMLQTEEFCIWTKPSYWHLSRMIFAFLATLWHCWRMFSLWPTATSWPRLWNCCPVIPISYLFSWLFSSAVLWICPYWNAFHLFNDHIPVIAVMHLLYLFSSSFWIQILPSV